jgi:hypothetical protein
VSSVCYLILMMNFLYYPFFLHSSWAARLGSVGLSEGAHRGEVGEVGLDVVLLCARICPAPLMGQCNDTDANRPRR